MSQVTVEKSFTGFVKIVIGATSLLAMGTVVAASAFLKGFKEGAKSVKDTFDNKDEKTEPKGDAAEADDTSDEPTEAQSNRFSDEKAEE